MATLLRIVLYMVWATGVGWLWRGGSLGTGSALLAMALGLMLCAWRFGPARRRRSELRYVQMGKQPVARA